MEARRAAVMEVMTGNEDLLTEILVRLPSKPLVRFKSVSKTWLRIISDTQLRRRSSQRFCKEASGLLRIPLNLDSEPSRHCQFFPVHGNEPARNPLLEGLDFVPGEEKLEVVNHCNGLLLCSSKSGEQLFNYYVFNPTTKEYTTVSVELRLRDTDFKLCAANLAFDPRKSLHYKLLFVYRSELDFRLRIYSSETGVARHIDKPFPSHAKTSALHSGVYWNCAVNWVAGLHEGFYFNMDEERFGKHPVLPIPEDVEKTEMFTRSIVYFGESNDHLHLIETYDTLSTSPILQFDVYEMDRGYSRWFQRFHVDIQPLFTSFSLPIHNLILMPRRMSTFVIGRTDNPSSLHVSSVDLPRRFGVMGVVRKDDDEKSFLVVSLPGMVCHFNFQDKSFVQIAMTGEHELYDYVDSVEFIESIYPLSNSGNSLVNG